MHTLRVLTVVHRRRVIRSRYPIPVGVFFPESTRTTVIVALAALQALGDLLDDRLLYPVAGVFHGITPGIDARGSRDTVIVIHAAIPWPVEQALVLEAFVGGAGDAVFAVLRLFTATGLVQHRVDTVGSLAGVDGAFVLVVTIPAAPPAAVVTAAHAGTTRQAALAFEAGHTVDVRAAFLSALDPETDTGSCFAAEADRTGTNALTALADMLSRTGLDIAPEAAALWRTLIHRDADLRRIES